MSGGYSPGQLEAITSADGPVVLAAGAGCGKTTTLAGRIAYLINERGLDPASILMLSFTTEAARRLHGEVAGQLGDRAADVSILTLHALGRRIIDTWATQLGYLERPAVLHQDEARALLSSTADALGWDLAIVSVGELAAAVDRCRLLVSPEARDADPLAGLTRAYEDRLRRHGAIDFVAMLSLPLQLFERDAQALRTLQDAYASVMVDEVQDLDLAQWRMIDLLAERHRNLFVAGDDRQCLYTWRGADPHALAHFAERHPDAPVITLDKNHRSTRRLVDVGNALADLFGQPVSLWTDNPDGPLPRLQLAEDEHAEARLVAQQIGSLLDRGLLPHPGEAAVIFRTRAQADVLAAALRDAVLPYHIHGNADLFETRVMRDVLAYLRLAISPTDRAALTRIVDVPPRGLMSLAAAIVEEPVAVDQLPARAAAFSPAAVASAAGLVAVIYDLHAHASRGIQPVALLDRILDRSGMRFWIENHPDGVRRLRLVGRLRWLLQRMDSSLAEWLDRAALGEVLVQPDDQAVRLSSVHGAKGHEWRATWVVGIEEGLMPHYRAVEAAEASGDTSTLDEELRGLYVAVTRARERLCLSACLRRTRGEGPEPRVPSRWLHALGPDLIAAA